jgi:hypothetical protein
LSGERSRRRVGQLERVETSETGSINHRLAVNDTISVAKSAVLKRRMVPPGARTPKASARRW